MNNRDITLKNSKIYLNNNSCDIYKEVSAESFVSQFDSALPHAPAPECVDSHTVEECKNMKCLRSKNGFVAIEQSGNITAVMRDARISRKEEKRKDFLRDLIANAKANGGDKLDCFAIIDEDKNGNSRAGLADMYAKLGFVPVCRDKFNKAFAPDDWDYEENHEPDIVFMYNNDSVDKILEKANNKKYPSYLDYLNQNKVPYIQDIMGEQFDPENSYGQALAYRDQIMNEDKMQRGIAVQQSDVDNIHKIPENELVDENTDDISKK